MNKRRRIELPQHSQRLVFQTSPWVSAINAFHEALPRCNEKNLVLISPRNAKRRKLMKGVSFKASRYEVKQGAAKDFVVTQKRKRSELYRIVALDPGVSTFQTSYGTDGVISIWGKEVLHELSRKDVKEMHRKLTVWLCTAYDLILVPDFGVQTKWRHAAFVKRLRTTAPKYNAEIRQVEEFCTTQTCSACGVRIKLRGNIKRFRCPACKFTAQRDINAAKNILLKFLSQD